MRKAKIELNPTQYEVLNSQFRENHLIAGLGNGKSFTIGAFIIQNCGVVGSLGLLGAPTYDTLRDSTLPQVEEAFAKIGLLSGYDYVINREPPREWGIKPYSELSNRGVMTFRWGSYVLLGSMKNFNRWRGVELDYIAVDEFRDVDEKARDVLLGRLRGRAFKHLQKAYRILFATTPPDNPSEYLKLIERMKDKAGFFFGTTHDNAHNLPEGYAESLQESLDERTFRREVLGLLERYVDNLFLWVFNENEHVATGLEIDPTLPIWLSFDFNVNPITCILSQHTSRQIRIIKEFRQPNSNIYKLCPVIKPYLQGHRVYVTGDPSGADKDAGKRENENMYYEIGNLLKINMHNFKVLNSHPLHSNSQVLCNSIFQRFPDIKIDKSCEFLIDDIKNVQMLDNSIDKSDASRTHLLDCMRYYLHANFGNFVKLKKYQNDLKMKNF